MGFLSGKSVAIVGNGPSGNNQGQEIDACDFVVRQKRWLTQGPVNAGSKVSAVCAFDDQLEMTTEMESSRDWEIWCNIPARCFQAEPTEKDPASWKWLLCTAAGRGIRLLRMDSLGAMTKSIKEIDPSWEHIPHVTLGTCCLSMAIDMQPKEIHIWGYDRTGYGRTNDDWAQQKFDLPQDMLYHNHLAEKILISKLADEGTWCGKPCESKLFWHGRPRLLGESK